MSVLQRSFFALFAFRRSARLMTFCKVSDVSLEKNDFLPEANLVGVSERNQKLV